MKLLLSYKSSIIVRGIIYKDPFFILWEGNKNNITYIGLIEIEQKSTYCIKTKLKNNG